MAFNDYKPEIKKSSFDAKITDIYIVENKDTTDGLSADTSYIPVSASNKVIADFNKNKNTVIYSTEGKASVTVGIKIDVSSNNNEEGQVNFQLVTYYGDSLSIDIDNTGLSKKEMITYITGGVKVEINQDKLKNKDKNGDFKEYDINKTPQTIEGDLDAENKKVTLSSSQEIKTITETSLPTFNSIGDLIIILNKVKIVYEIIDGDGKKTSKTTVKTMEKPLLLLNSFEQNNDYCLIGLPKGLYGRNIQSSQNLYEIRSIPLYYPKKLAINVIVAYIGLMLHNGIAVSIELDSYVLSSFFETTTYSTYFYNFGKVFSELKKQENSFNIHYYDKENKKYEVAIYEAEIKANTYKLDIADVINKIGKKINGNSFFIEHNSNPNNKLTIYVPSVSKGIYSINPSMKFSSKLDKDFYLSQNSKGTLQSMQRLLFVEHLAIQTFTTMALSAFEEYAVMAIATRGLGGSLVSGLTRVVMYIAMGLVEYWTSLRLQNVFADVQRKITSKANYETTALYDITRRTETPKLTADIANKQDEMYRKSFDKEENGLLASVLQIVVPLFNTILNLETASFKENDYSASIDVNDIDTEDFFDYKKTLLLTDEMKWFLVNSVSRFFEANIAQMVGSMFSSDLVTPARFRTQSKISFNGDDIKEGRSTNPIFSYKGYIVYSKQEDEEFMVSQAFLLRKNEFIKKTQKVLDNLKEKKSGNAPLMFYVKLLNDYAKTSSCWTTIACFEAKSKQDNQYYRDGPMKCIPEFAYNADEHKIKTGNTGIVDLNDVSGDVDKAGTKTKISENVYLYSI